MCFLKDFIYLFLERREEKEKERERNMDMRDKHQSVASHTHLNQGIELATFRYVDSTQPTEPHWSGGCVFF